MSKDSLTNKHLLFILILSLMSTFLNVDYIECDETPERKNHILFIDTADNVLITNKIVNEYNNEVVSKPEYRFINTNFVKQENYLDELQLILSTNSRADLFQLPSAASVNLFMKNGYLLDLSEILLNSSIDFSAFETSLDSITNNGLVPALPRITNHWLLFYNLDLFNRYNISFPYQMSWNQYAILSQRLTGGYGASKIWGGVLPYNILNLGALNMGEYLTDDELPYSKKYIELLHKMIWIDESHPKPERQSSMNIYKLFLNNKIAMFVDTDKAISSLEHERTLMSKDTNWNIAPLPTFSKTLDSYTVTNSSYLAVSSQYELVPNDISYFLEKACGSEGAYIMADNLIIPSYFSDIAAMHYVKKSNIINTDIITKIQKWNIEGKHPNYLELSTSYNKIMNDYLTGEITLEKGFSTFLNEREFILNK